jgi:hypothetical protein
VAYRCKGVANNMHTGIVLVHREIYQIRRWKDGRKSA